MKLCGRNISPELITQIQDRIDSQPELSRVQLARQLCDSLDWRNPNGELKEMSCRKGLLKLHRQGRLRLPEAKVHPNLVKSSSDYDDTLFPEPQPVECSLSELGRLKLVRVKRGYRQESRRWNAMMHRYHYLGEGPLCGCQIRYFIESEHFGTLGGLAFSASAWSVSARDHWIHWDHEIRQQRLNQVINNSRFLILSTVQVKNLASHVLALAAKQIVVDWADEEFGTAQLGDQRRVGRLLNLARDFYARPQASIPQACQSRAKTKAAYRFLEEANTTMEKILKPHYQATQHRCKQEKVVLAVQDTTTLNYSAHPATENMGPISKQKNNSIGLIVHDTMAFNEDRTPLGLLDVQCWARDPDDFGKHHRRHQLPIEQKESYKWLMSFQAVSEVQKQCPDTLFVSVGDRDADIYDLFQVNK